MPSPESPAKRIVTRSSSWVSGSSSRVVVTWCSAPFGSVHELMRSRRQVQQLLGERFGEVLQDVLRPDDALQHVAVVEERHVAVAAGLHQLHGGPDGVLEMEVMGP